MSDLTLSDVVALADIVRAAQGGTRVIWSPDGGETVYEGVARSIGDQNFCRTDGDVREMFLRVTLLAGSDTALRISDVVTWHHESVFHVR